MYKYIANAGCVSLTMLQIYDCIGASGEKLPKLFFFVIMKDGSLLQQYWSPSLIFN